MTNHGWIHKPPWQESETKRIVAVIAINWVWQSGKYFLLFGFVILWF